MSELTFGLANVTDLELQSIDMRLPEEIPIPPEPIVVRVAKSVASFVFYLGALLAALSVVMIISAYIALYLIVYGLVFVNDHWPRQFPQEGKSCTSNYTEQDCLPTISTSSDPMGK